MSVWGHKQLTIWLQTISQPLKVDKDCSITESLDTLPVAHSVQHKAPQQSYKSLDNTGTHSFDSNASNRRFTWSREAFLSIAIADGCSFLPARCSLLHNHPARAIFGIRQWHSVHTPFVCTCGRMHETRSPVAAEATEEILRLQQRM